MCVYFSEAGDRFCHRNPGVKAERQQMKSVRCKKDVGLPRRRKDRTEMDEAGMRDVHSYLSSLYTSICIYITLSILIWTHTPRLTSSSLTHTDGIQWRTGRGERKEQDSQALLSRPAPLVHCFLSASLTDRALQDHPDTHTHTCTTHRCGAYMHLYMQHILRVAGTYCF